MGETPSADMDANMSNLEPETSSVQAIEPVIPETNQLQQIMPPPDTLGPPSLSELSETQHTTSSIQQQAAVYESSITLNHPFLANNEPLLELTPALEEVATTQRIGCTSQLTRCGDPSDQPYDEPLNIELEDLDEEYERDNFRPLPKTDSSQNRLLREPISNDKLFSEVTEYEEEFLLNENMVNNYTFSDESKSTDYSSDSPAPNDLKQIEDSQVQEKKVSDDDDGEQNKKDKRENMCNIDEELEAELAATEVDREELLNESLNEDMLLNVSDSLDSENVVVKQLENAQSIELNKQLKTEQSKTVVESEKVEQTINNQNCFNVCDNNTQLTDKTSNIITVSPTENKNYLIGETSVAKTISGEKTIEVNYNQKIMMLKNTSVELPSDEVGVTKTTEVAVKETNKKSTPEKNITQDEMDSETSAAAEIPQNSDFLSTDLLMNTENEKVGKRPHEKMDDDENKQPEKVLKTGEKSNESAINSIARLDDLSKNDELCSRPDGKIVYKETTNESGEPSTADQDLESRDSNEDSGLQLGDSLGLLLECRTMEREEQEPEPENDEDEPDDVPNDDDESNQMAPDSSEVESNSAVNEDQEIDPSDVDITNQSEQDTTNQNDDDIDQSLENIARAIIVTDENSTEGTFELTPALNNTLVKDDRSSVSNTEERKDLPTSPKKTALKEDPIQKSVPEAMDNNASLEQNATDIEKKLETVTETNKIVLPDTVTTAPTPVVTSPKKTPEKNDCESPSKARKLQVARPDNVVSFVELEESSSDSDVQETKIMQPPSIPCKKKPPPINSEHQEDKVTVNLPKDIDIMSTSGGVTSEIISNKEENLISGLPAPLPAKKVTPRINTSEITIKTQKVQDNTITINDEADEEKDKKKLKLSLEVFSVDSDEDEPMGVEGEPKKLSAIELQRALDSKKCINYLCKSDGGVGYNVAPSYVLSYYEVKRSKKCTSLVCTPCLDKVTQRTADLMEGILSAQPLLSLNMEKSCQELVEISDSDSDSDGEDLPGDSDKLDADTVKYLEQQLSSMINETWSKYGMAEQLSECERELKQQLDEIQKGCDEVDRLLADEQRMTDQIRTDLYATFASEVKELPPIEIIEPPLPAVLTPPPTPHSESSDQSDSEQSRRSKRPRRHVQYNEMANNTARDSDSPVITSVKLGQKAGDDNADVSVVKLSAESAPADLPSPGELVRSPLGVGNMVWAARQTNVGSWALAKITEIWLPGTIQGKEANLTHMKIRFEHKLKGPSVRQLTGKGVAYQDAALVRLTIGTRVIALFKPTTGQAKESFYSGIIAEMPTPVNNFRYLIFFDDGYAQYVSHPGVRVVYETSIRVWEDVHIDSKEFVKKYLINYPERPMVRLQEGQALKAEWNGKWWLSHVVKVDASLAQVQFDTDGRLEWIYRGSTRLAPLYLHLQASDRNKRGLTRQHRPYAAKANAPYVEYTRSDEQDTAKPVEPQKVPEDDNRRANTQRAVAKKSTGPAPTVQPPVRTGAPLKPHEDLMTRVVYYSPKSAVRPHKMVPHKCTPSCRRTDVLPLKELKTYNPLTRPLLTGWERQILRFKGKKMVMYRSPCGRRIRDMRELHKYLRAIDSDCGVDLFDFNPATHCLAEFVINTCYVHKKDLSHGKENVPVPCVNYYDHSLPEFCLYNTERTPTSGVPLNLNPEFLCGCDCTDDCQDKSKCACWKLTLEGARTIGLDGDGVGYHFKRLPEPLPSGIYECNSRCKCKSTCLNRVAQHPLQLKLQVFKTNNRGWGIRALNDIPKGAFLCVYAGNLLTDATANLDGINEGDEYLAELDYIEVVERMKEDYESDVPEDKDGDNDEEKTESEEEEEEVQKKNDYEDKEFRVDYTPGQKFTKSLRKRKVKADPDAAEKEKIKEAEKEKTETEGEGKEKMGENESCITISDDEEVREPSRFTAQTGLDEDFVPRHLSVRACYGIDEKCYIMDAKVQGNIGRYLNHSCSPNVFVQNVFVDTHDPRFPWVAFFALSHIHAGHELTWNYNYDIGSVPDKVMYCKCGAPNCRGRLL